MYGITWYDIVSYAEAWYFIVWYRYGFIWYGKVWHVIDGMIGFGFVSCLLSYGAVWQNILHTTVCLSRADFHFFHRRGGKILGGVQVICNMPFLML